MLLNNIHGKLRVGVLCKQSDYVGYEPRLPLNKKVAKRLLLLYMLRKLIGSEFFASKAKFRQYELRLVTRSIAKGDAAWVAKSEYCQSDYVGYEPRLPLLIMNDSLQVVICY